MLYSLTNFTNELNCSVSPMSLNPQAYEPEHIVRCHLPKIFAGFPPWGQGQALEKFSHQRFEEKR